MNLDFAIIKHLILLAAAVLAAGSASAADFHVSPKGDDTTGDGSPAKPFATLEKARDAVRAYKLAHVAAANTILLHGGEYRLTRPVVFGPEDSGSPEAPFTVCAAPGEKPVLTSATPITGWKLADAATPNLATEAQGKVWVADIPKGWRFHALYADGKPMQVARLFKHNNWHAWSCFTSIGPVGPGGQLLGVPKGQLDGLPDNGDVEMDLLPEVFWNSLSVVRDFDRKASTLRRHSKVPNVCAKKNEFHHDGASDFGYYNLLNALKFLSKPGEWAVDSAAGKVYFWPEKDSPDAMSVLAPRLYRLVEVSGDKSKASLVHDIHLRSLSFECTDRLPEDQWPDDWIKRNSELPDAMLRMTDVEGCVVEGCTFFHSGSYCVGLMDHARKNRILRNEMGFPGCGGVLMQGYGPGTLDVNKNNTIRRNYIHHMGNGGYMHSAAITLFQSGENDISLNLIDHAPYTAIVIVGSHTTDYKPGQDTPMIWDSYGNADAMYHVRWNELPKGRDTVFPDDGKSLKVFLHSRNNRVVNNIVLNYMERLHDGGGLYSWGCGTGNLWEGNLLHGTTGGWGVASIYMDDQSDHSIVRGNVCWIVSKPNTSRGQGIVWDKNEFSGSKTAAYDRCLAEISGRMIHSGGLLNGPDEMKVIFDGQSIFMDSGTVSLSSILGGTLRYTLDGAEPTAQSAPYTAPIRLTETATVKARIFDAQGKALASSERMFRKAQTVSLALGTQIKAADALLLDGPRFDDKKNIGWCENGGAFAFGPYEFQHGQLQAVEVMVGVDPRYAGGKLHVRLDRKDGPIVGTLVLSSTGGFENFRPQAVNVWATPGTYSKGNATGKHLLWFTIEGNAVCNFKGFRILDAAGVIVSAVRAAPTDPHIGWAEPRYHTLNQAAAKSNADVVFIGDSITHGWENTGKAAWDKQIAPFNALNLGIGGDRIEHMTWRLENGNLPDTLNPKVAVVMAGTNNTGVAGITPAAIAAGNRELVARIQKHKPGCKVLLLGIFPHRQPSDALVQKTNPLLTNLADGKSVFFLDFSDKFRSADGKPDAKFYTDAVHINAAGYQVWADAMLPVLKELLAK